MNSRVVYTAGNESRRPKSSRRTLARWGIFFLFLGTAAGIVMLLGAEQLQVKDVSFSGLKTLSADELRDKVFRKLSGEYALLMPKRSVFLIQKNALASMLQKEFPRLRTVAVRREFPSALAIAVEERQLWAILCNDALTPENSEDVVCVYTDDTGFAFEEAPYSRGSLILKIRTDFSEIKAGAEILAPEVAVRLRLLQERVEEITGSRVIRFEFLRQVPSEIRVEMDEGFALMFLREGDFDNAFRVLKTVLEQEIKDKRQKLEYVDLRFGNKVFYKFR